MSSTTPKDKPTHTKVKIRTTLPVRPLPPSSSRAALLTPRLEIRPFAPTDLEGLHAVRAQSEVMISTSMGRPDRSLSETQTFMDRYLAPNDGESFNFVVCLRDTGEVIGMAGMHKFDFTLGWPEVGYLFKREHWGSGYASEFLGAWLRAWWELPRETVLVEVERATVMGFGGGNVKKGKDGDENVKNENVAREVCEMIAAKIEANNGASRRVLEKFGFQEFDTWVEPDGRVGFEGQEVELVGFVRGSPVKTG
ncbi:acetyltransferase domain-containing protein [Xylariomycetidae sp. FL2044]|nr:acetyltransferase domain-containing protein [Xylariomycetidae sp. FL2044]